MRSEGAKTGLLMSAASVTQGLAMRSRHAHLARVSWSQKA
ncbi:hypothetical protein DyAD56_16390 [Dyella sp. AD56]|nr:hypothetical protein DyAD56_16390 [Dyella sp. AD56]ULU27366.1 hypothetical protein DYST_04321 [Dyella terrae]